MTLYRIEDARLCSMLCIRFSTCIERYDLHICDSISGYRLVIICSKEDEEKSHIISRLHLHKRPAVPSFSHDDFKKYLVSHFVHCEGEMDDRQTNPQDTKVYASAVDPDM